MFIYAYLDGSFSDITGDARLSSITVCRERLVWFAPFQPLPHGEPQPRAGVPSVRSRVEPFADRRLSSQVVFNWISVVSAFGLCSRT